MTRVCQHCAAWSPWGMQRVSHGAVPVTDESVGQCRARPPAIDPESISGTNAAWPIVSADDWCLDFRASHQNAVAHLGAAPSRSGHGGPQA